MYSNVLRRKLMTSSLRLRGLLCMNMFFRNLGFSKDTKLFSYHACQGRARSRLIRRRRRRSAGRSDDPPRKKTYKTNENISFFKN